MADKRDSCVEWLADAVENLGLLTRNDANAWAGDFVEDLPSHVRHIAAGLLGECKKRECVGRLFIAKMIIDRACQNSS